MVAPSLDPLREKLDVARRTVEEQFPRYWFSIEALLSAMVTLKIADVRDPASLILEGPPSSGKSTCLRIVEYDPLTYRSDKFTPKAFVTLQANKTEEELRRIDLLPKIKDKCLVVSDLAPTFSDRSDRLYENIGILTRVFDGEGLTLDAGSVGRRGYDEPHMFVMIGATTLLSNMKRRMLAKLGNRLCFLDVTHLPSSRSELTADLIEGRSYGEKVRQCKNAVSEFLEGLNNLDKVEWNRSADDRTLLDRIVGMAQLSGRCRGVIPTERLYSGGYEKGYPEIEGPERFYTLLYNLARGHALVNGRTSIDALDLPLVREVALSSMPRDRANIIRLLARREDVSTSEIEGLLKCSKPLALDVMDDLRRLDVVEREEQRLRGSIFQLGPDFKECLA